MYRSALLDTIQILVIVAAVSVLIATLLLSVLQIRGSSMSPTLEDGQIVLASLVDTMRAETENTVPAEDVYDQQAAAIPAVSVNTVMATEEIDGNRYIGIVEIPNLGISLPVAENYTDEQLHIAP